MSGGANAEGRSPTRLMWAAWHGDVALVRQHLGQAGRSDGNGETALMWAARGDRMHHDANCGRGRYGECISLLLDTGREAHGRNQRRETALMWAARCGYRERVELLLRECGEATRYGWTALIWAASYNRQDCIGLLMQNDSERRASKWTDLIYYYAASGKKERLEAKLAGWEGELPRDSAGRTALMYAAACGHDGILNLLIERGDGMVDKYERTALMSAACTGQEQCVCTLIRHQLNEQDRNGWTALMWAVCECRRGCVDLLKKERDKETIERWRGFDRGTKAIDIARRKLGEAERRRGAGEGAPALNGDGCRCEVNMEELNHRVDDYRAIIQILSDEIVEEEANGD